MLGHAAAAICGGGVVVALDRLALRFGRAVADLCASAIDVPVHERPGQAALGLSAFGVPLLVAGMMVSAFAWRHVQTTTT